MLKAFGLYLFSCLSSVSRDFWAHKIITRMPGPWGSHDVWWLSCLWRWPYYGFVNTCASIPLLYVFCSFIKQVVIWLTCISGLAVYFKMKFSWVGALLLAYLNWVWYQVLQPFFMSLIWRDNKQKHCRLNNSVIWWDKMENAVGNTLSVTHICRKLTWPYAFNFFQILINKDWMCVCVWMNKIYDCLK